MPNHRLLALARDERARAEEILLKAETFKDADAKKRARELARKYLELAAQLEKAAADDP
jgi:hypothetical protein